VNIAKPHSQVTVDYCDTTTGSKYRLKPDLPDVVWQQVSVSLGALMLKYSAATVGAV